MSRFVVTQMVRWNGSVASLHYAGMTRPLIIADLPGTLPQDPITLILRTIDTQLSIEYDHPEIT